MNSDLPAHVSDLKSEELRLIQRLEKELGDKYILIAYDKIVEVENSQWNELNTIKYNNG